MPRCAIFTEVGYYNYGNRLLCYATCKIFASLGVDAEIIRVKNDDENLPFLIRLKRKIKNAFKLRFNHMLIKTFNLFVKGIKKRVIRTQYQRFVDFSMAHIVEKDYGLSKYYFPPSFSSHFDFFVVGSDQVWNPLFGNTNVPGTVFFLPFVRNEKRAFMFSTSFGVSKDDFFAQAIKIPGLADAYRNALSRMSHISCREDAGVEITNSLVGKGQILVDPTMILTQEEWLSMAKEPTFLPSRVKGRNGYAVLLFWGVLPRFLKKRIKKFCEDRNLEPISLNNLFDESAYVIDPAEFVYLLANADAIYTDSFHGTVFSILFEVPFFTFDPFGYGFNVNSRLDTLLRIFNFKERFIKNAKEFCPEGKDFRMDFSEVREILSREREKAIHFLKTAISEKMT